MHSSKTSTRPVLVLALISIIGLAAGLGSLALEILPVFWAVLLSAGATLLILGSLWWEMAPQSLGHSVLTTRDLLGHPLAVLVILLAVTAPALALSVISFQRVTDIEEAVVCGRSITIVQEDTGVYNAALDRPDIYPDGGRVDADYLSSPNPEPVLGETVMGFSYTMVPGREARETETAGAYITFYEDPVDISDFDSLSFSIDGDMGDEGREVDVAVRLAVDDPSLPPKEREVVVRVSPSLQELGHFLSGQWERITIDLGEFTLLPFLKPAEQVDPKKVNKIVIFVDNDIVDRSPSGTVRIKDISFEKHGGQGGCR